MATGVIMKVSVLLPVYNGQETLSETIRSILSQTYQDLELIIVNDGSTDQSEQVIKKFSDKRIKYILQKNTGAPAAPRNVAAKASSGDLLALCDQDDVWYPQKLEKQLEAFKNANKDKNIGIIYSRADFIDKNGKKLGVSQMPVAKYLSAIEAHQKLLSGIFITACSALFTKEAYQYSGGFDESLVGNDEYDLYIKITEKYGILSTTDILCAWRSDPGSLSGNISKMYIENEKIFDKLEKTEKDKNILELARLKNTNRIIVSTLLEGKTELSKKYAKVADNKNNSKKGRIIAKIVVFSPTVARFIVVILKKIGLVSV